MDDDNSNKDENVYEEEDNDDFFEDFDVEDAEINEKKYVTILQEDNILFFLEEETWFCKVFKDNESAKKVKSLFLEEV